MYFHVIIISFYLDPSHVEISIVMETRDGELVAYQELSSPVKVPVAPKAAKRWPRALMTLKNQLNGDILGNGKDIDQV